VFLGGATKNNILNTDATLSPGAANGFPCAFDSDSQAEIGLNR
jgi:hypothetical protein